MASCFVYLLLLPCGFMDGNDVYYTGVWVYIMVFMVGITVIQVRISVYEMSNGAARALCISK